MAIGICRRRSFFRRMEADADELLSFILDVFFILGIDSRAIDESVLVVNNLVGLRDCDYDDEILVFG